MSICRSRTSPVQLLIFNASLPALACCLLFPNAIVRKLCIFQWKLKDAGCLKRIALHSILERSSVILVYDIQSFATLAEFPRLRAKLIPYPIFTDTSFFRPREDAAQQTSSRIEIICVGDHLRDESLVALTAELMPECSFIRVSTHYQKTAAGTPSNLIVRTGLSFTELQQLYLTADAALVLTVETSFPVGITSVAEAVACGLPLVATRGAGTGYFVESENIRFVTRECSPESVRTALVEVLLISRTTPCKHNLNQLSPEACVQSLVELNRRLYAPNSV